MESKIDTKNWIPVGNQVMLRPAKIGKKNPFEIESLAQKDAYEVIGFGSAYKADGLEDKMMVGDKVIIIENEAKRSKGTKISIGGEEVWFYPPEEIALILRKDEGDSEYKLIPIHDFCLLERFESETMIGNLYIPHTAEEKSVHAKVRYIGTGVSSNEEKKHEFSVAVGDEVIISKWNNNELEIDGKTYILEKESEILAKVENQ